MGEQYGSMCQINSSLFTTPSHGIGLASLDFPVHDPDSSQFWTRRDVSTHKGLANGSKGFKTQENTIDLFAFNPAFQLETRLKHSVCFKVAPYMAHGCTTHTDMLCYTYLRCNDTFIRHYLEFRSALQSI